MLRTALTGGIASGKTYVLARFASLGVPTIDADVLAREVVAAGTPGLAAIVERFGSEVLDASGTLDRARLGAMIFADDEARRELERIVHPRVYAAIASWLEDLTARRSAAFAMADIPLLFETGHEGGFDVVVVAACPPEMQLARLRERDRLTEVEARRRLAAQWGITEKVRLADYVIHTDGSFADTDRQVQRVFLALETRAARVRD